MIRKLTRCRERRFSEIFRQRRIEAMESSEFIAAKPESIVFQTVL
jgi:hypothetical protein